MQKKLLSVPPGLLGKAPSAHQLWECWGYSLSPPHLLAMGQLQAFDYTQFSHMRTLGAEWKMWDYYAVLFYRLVLRQEVGNWCRSRCYWTSIPKNKLSCRFPTCRFQILGHKLSASGPMLEGCCWELYKAQWPLLLKGYNGGFSQHGKHLHICNLYSNLWIR